MIDGDTLGLERNVVRVVPHDPSWPLLGHDLRLRIVRAAGDLVVEVAHVGSTSVPDLGAKPILDLAVGAPSEALEPALATILTGLGYVYVEDTGSAGGHLFALPTAPNVHAVHLHVVEHGGAQWHNYLIFRDVLRRDPDVRGAYAEVKRRLGERFPGDRVAYTEGKHAFVRGVLERYGGVPQ